MNPDAGCVSSGRVSSAAAAARPAPPPPGLLRRRCRPTCSAARAGAAAAAAGIALLALLPSPAAGTPSFPASAPLEARRAAAVLAELAPPRPARGATAVTLAAASPPEGRTEQPAPAPAARRADSGLALRLPEFDSPVRVAEGEERPGRIGSPGLAGLAGLVLRFDGGPDSPLLPAEAAVPPEPVVPASPGVSRPSAPVASPPPAPVVAEVPENGGAPAHGGGAAAVVSPAPSLEPGRAAASEAAPPSPTWSGAVPSVPAPPAGELTLQVGQGRRIQLDGEATAVLVASPEVADVQLPLPNVLYVVAKSIGRTSVAVFRGGELLEERSVSVVLNLDPLYRILSGEPGLAGVRVQRLPRGLVLSGEVASPAAAERALRLASNSLPEGVRVENDLRITGLQQVNLEVQIAEVSRAVTEVLGVNWEAFRQTTGETFGFRIGRAFRNADGLLVPLVDDRGNLASSLHFRGVNPRARFDAMLDALSTAGLANVLARPNVTAVSGESASFFSGGEYPLPAGVEDGVIVFEPRRVGVVLDFVPTVVDSGRIVLTVRPEVSERSLNESVQIAQGINYPVINVRRAETTVEVGDGESIVIAGLFRNTSSTVESGVPGLKDVPALGLLFGRTATQADELELIVIVTARLVRPNTAPADTGVPPAVRRVGGYHY